MGILMILFQVMFLIVISPLLSGIIRKLKNNLRMRKGQSIFQPYFNLFKLFGKGEVISVDASWIFKIAPFIAVSFTAAALFLVPLFVKPQIFNYLGDLILILFLFAGARFFLALAALDAGSAFGGMGSSRDVFVSSLIEPVALLAIFTISLGAGSTNPWIVSGLTVIFPSTLVAAAAFFISAMAETSRVPFDNQETHLELTMIHEAMVLEYSGRRLGLIELTSHLKQIILFSLIANVMLPYSFSQTPGITGLITNIALYFLKLIGAAFIVSLLEVSLAKMRLFRVADVLFFSFILSIISLVMRVMGL